MFTGTNGKSLKKELSMLNDQVNGEIDTQKIKKKVTNPRLLNIIDEDESFVDEKRPQSYKSTSTSKVVLQKNLTQSVLKRKLSQQSLISPIVKKQMTSPSETKKKSKSIPDNLISLYEKELKSTLPKDMRTSQQQNSKKKAINISNVKKGGNAIDKDEANDFHDMIEDEIHRNDIVDDNVVDVDDDPENALNKLDEIEKQLNLKRKQNKKNNIVEDSDDYSSEESGEYLDNDDDDDDDDNDDDENINDSIIKNSKTFDSKNEDEDDDDEDDDDDYNENDTTLKKSSYVKIDLTQFEPDISDEEDDNDSIDDQDAETTNIHERDFKKYILAIVQHKIDKQSVIESNFDINKMVVGLFISIVMEIIKSVLSQSETDHSKNKVVAYIPPESTFIGNAESARFKSIIDFIKNVVRTIINYEFEKHPKKEKKCFLCNGDKCPTPQNYYTLTTISSADNDDGFVENKYNVCVTTLNFVTTMMSLRIFRKLIEQKVDDILDEHVDIISDTPYGVFKSVCDVITKDELFLNTQLLDLQKNLSYMMNILPQDVKASLKLKISETYKNLSPESIDFWLDHKSVEKKKNTKQ
jgi:hypothetical protein